MYSRMLVPIDASPISQRGLNEALALARQLGSALRLLNVVDARLLLAEVSERSSPNALLQAWHEAGDRLVASAIDAARSSGVAAQGVVRCDPGQRVCDLILEEAHGSAAELIVMGTHGRRGWRRLALGSDAEFVLRHSPIPVLLVRGAAPDAAT
jgi:nucleotide-binding universal stress UspA family protein